MNVVFSIGTGVTAHYNIFEGTESECQEFINTLPSVNDEGWLDAWTGTNPFQEACSIEE